MRFRTRLTWFRATKYNSKSLGLTELQALKLGQFSRFVVICFFNIILAAVKYHGGTEKPEKIRKPVVVKKLLKSRGKKWDADFRR